MTGSVDKDGNIRILAPLWQKIVAGITVPLLVALIVLCVSALSEWKQARDDIPANTRQGQANKEGLTELANSLKILAIAVEANTDFRNEGPRVTTRDLQKIEDNYTQASERQNRLLESFITTNRENTALLTGISSKVGEMQVELKHVIKEQERARDDIDMMRGQP